VLGVYGGSAEVRLGGPGGALLGVAAGDVVVIPAGVAHKNESQSADFRVVGAYPTGTSPDMMLGEPGERPAADQRIAGVAMPASDPLGGCAGALTTLWY
jgi:uncharacterized protein YjlB